MDSTHFNFDPTIPADLGLTVWLNPTSVGHADHPAYVHVKLGPLDLTVINPAEADRIAAAFTEAARLLREAAAVRPPSGGEDAA